MNNKLILIDQDGVLADFNNGILHAWHHHYGEDAPIDPKRPNFYVRDDTPPAHHQRLQALYSAPGFFAQLAPIEGSLQALHTLLAHGHDVRICTSPINDYRHCVGEKIAWVEEHLGFEWTHRVILTKDKTWVRGDILIDDKPSISGTLTPLWTHRLYDASYNRHIPAKQRIIWSDTATWADLLNEGAKD